MCRGFLKRLLAETEESIELLRHYVFHVVPMVNPDGVQVGNYRCSLAGAPSFPSRDSEA